MAERREPAVDFRPRGFRSYPDYKDSAVDWLGSLPTHWDTTRLRFVVETKITKQEVKALTPETEVSFVPMEAVGEYGGIDLGSTKPLADVLDGYTYFRNGDVVVAKITPCFENGKGALANDLCSDIGFGTTELHVLRATAKLDTRFLLYLTFSHHFRRIGAASMFGAGGQKRVSDDFIRTFPHPLPGLSEQRTIASFLDRETKRIDALVETKERLIELLQEKRTALITRAVTRGLDPNVPMKDSGVEWLGEMPANWEMKPLSYKLERITYGFTNPMPTADEGPYMLTALDIGDGQILYENARRTTNDAFERDLTDKSRPRGGDLLLTKDGTLGRVAVADGRRVAINQSIALLRFDRSVHVRFMQHLLLAAPYQDRMAFEAGGTTIKHIYISRLARMPIGIPPKQDQKVISDFVGQEKTKADILIAKVHQAIDHLKEYRTALISAAVTGKIDVRKDAA